MLKTIRKSSLNEDFIQRIFVGVCGGSAAGKTTLCENINRQMAFDRDFKVEVISLDSFYRSLPADIDSKQYNFDHPSALDFDLAYETLLAMKHGCQKVAVPQYSFTAHQRLAQPVYHEPANIILFEGLMVFYDQRIRDLLTYKVFINCDDDIRLCRRLRRDTTERNRSIQSVLMQYNKFVKCAFRDFILPSSVYADLIIPGFRSNRVSVDIIVQHIKNIARRINFRQKIGQSRIFFFGENEHYDFGYKQSEHHQSSMLTHQPQTFLVFPISQEQKKQLEFFMNILMTQMFSLQYFQEIFAYQFARSLKVLLNQLMILKNYKPQQISMYSLINPILAIKPLMEHDDKLVRMIIIPLILSTNCQKLLSYIEKQMQEHAEVTYILVTVFCDIRFPKLLYQKKINNCIMVNLFVVANEKKFRDALINNVRAYCDDIYYLINDELMQAVVKNIADGLAIINIININQNERNKPIDTSNQIQIEVKLD